MESSDLAKLNQQASKSGITGSSSGEVFLDPVLNYDHTYFCNVAVRADVNKAIWFKGPNAPLPSNPLISDVDEELYIQWQFNDTVDVTRVLIRAHAKPNMDDVSPPYEIWFYPGLNVTQPESSYLEEVYNETKVSYKVIIPAEKFRNNEEGIRIDLPVGRFRNIQTFSMYIRGPHSEKADGASDDSDDDDDDDEAMAEFRTFVNSISLIGKPKQVKDISQWEPCKS